MDTETAIIENNDSIASNSPEMRAKRLKRVRNLANLSREQMCEDSDINRYTLIGWENGRFAGLTLSGAEKIVAKVQKEGVHCTVEWLMEGNGPEPSVNPIPLLNNSDELLELSDDLMIAFFKTKNPYAVHLILDDDGMLPQYREGDAVVGKKRTEENIEATIGYDCIVETETGEVLFRNVRKGKHPQTYTLVCNNPSITERASVIPDVKLIYSAPVTWHRKKDSL